MSIPTFTHTGNVQLTLYRAVQGAYVSGVWVPGSEEEVVVKANVQPLKMAEIMSLPESERQRVWLKVYSASELRVGQEGTSGWDSDEFVWQGYRYRGMKVKNYAMGVLNHYCMYAARLPVTAGAESDKD